jgi:hypothetical protein
MLFDDIYMVTHLIAYLSFQSIITKKFQEECSMDLVVR